MLGRGIEFTSGETRMVCGGMGGCFCLFVLLLLSQMYQSSISEWDVCSQSWSVARHNWDPEKSRFASLLPPTQTHGGEWRISRTTWQEKEAAKTSKHTSLVKSWVVERDSHKSSWETDVSPLCISPSRLTALFVCTVGTDRYREPYGGVQG